MNWKKTLRKSGRLLLLASCLIGLGIFVSDWLVRYSAEPHRYSSVEKLPSNKVGLVLGTSKYTSAGYLNPYYQHRIQAAVTLFKAGKVKYLLLSGDNSRLNYNEPIQMKKDLLKAGIPPDRLILDYAGFRTLDSVVRSKKVFGQKAITIISQPFHNARALYIAQAYGLEAVAYDAQDVTLRYGLRVQIREKLARVKMFLDLLVNKQPRFLGERIEIGA